MATIVINEAKFPVGRVVVTAGASVAIDVDDYTKGLNRHIMGDWGNVDDPEENDKAIKTGHMLLSSYKTAKGIEYWIITEHDRSVTTILLPEDY